MFDRYRALFALRNHRGATAAEALTAIFGSSSALLKHEVAYVLGQMLDKNTTEALVAVNNGPFPHLLFLPYLHLKLLLPPFKFLLNFHLPLFFSIAVFFP
jgi:hypothetical protein